MPRTLGTQSSIPVLPSLPASPIAGDECLVGGIEYICLADGVWTPRAAVGSQPQFETPGGGTNYIYTVSGSAANYLVFLNNVLLEPGVEYTTSGSTFTLTSALARHIADSGGTLRAIRLGTPLSIPAGFFDAVPPASAHPNSLEMGGTTGLTLWTPSGNYSLGTTDHGVSVNAIGAPGGVDWGGAYFSLPTGSQWTMFAKCGITPGIPTTITDLRTVNWGIGLLQNTTNSSQLITLASGWTGGDSANGRNTHIFTTLWSNYTTFNTEYGAVYYGAHDEMASYFRITRNGSTYSYWFSRNGVYWSPLFSHTPPWTPAVGAILYCNGSNRALVGSAAHFYNVRFVNSADINLPYPGRRF